MWTDSCLYKEKYLKYWSRFSQVPFFALRKGKNGRSNSSLFFHCPILIPDLAGASASSAPANCRPGFLPSAVNDCLCPVCAGHSAGYIPAYWALPSIAADLHLAARTKLCPVCTFQMMRKELTLRIYAQFGQDHCKARHFCSLTALMTEVYSTGECCYPRGWSKTFLIHSQSQLKNQHRSSYQCACTHTKIPTWNVVQLSAVWLPFICLKGCVKQRSTFPASGWV